MTLSVSHTVNSMNRYREDRDNRDNKTLLAVHVSR